MKKVNLNALRMALAFVMVACLGFALVFMGTSTVKADAEPQTRTYNETFDRLLDNGKGNGADSAYRAMEWNAGKCASVSNPIFKIGSPKISAGFESLSLELRSPDGSITLSDLKIGLRVTDSDDDTQNNHSYEMAGDDFIGGVTFSQGTDIGADWSTMTIDFAQTETGIDTTAPDAMLGFHIYAKTAEIAGKLDIRKVYVTTGAIDTVILDFDGVNESWWYGADDGVATEYPMGYAITESKQITSSDGNLDEEYTAIVLNACGTGTVTLAPVNEDGTVGTAVAWTALTDLNGTALPALTSSVQNYVVSLASLGATKIKGIEVAVTGGEAFVAQTFFTNLESIVPDKYFPVLDLESIAYMSQFGFEYLTAGPDYTTAVTDAAAFNCDYILSYSAKNNVITDGHLVLDAQGEAFTSIKIRSKVASEGRRYAVIKYKLNGEATLNDFRFSAIDTLSDAATPVVYAHDLLVGNGLHSLSEANPYNEETYKYLVIDLDKTFGTAYVSGFEFYISGAGQVLIDEIYFADSTAEKLTLTEEILDEDFAGKEVTSSATGYAYVGYIDASKVNGADYMVMEVEGDISKLRVEFAGIGTYWVTPNDQGTLLDKYGKAFPTTTGAQTLYINLENTGVNGKIGAIHIHNDFTEVGQVLKITSVKFASYPEAELETTEEILATDFAGKEVTSTAADYAYIGYIDGAKGNGYKYMIMDVEGDISQLRMEFAGIGTYWITKNDAGTLVDKNGNTFPTTGKQTICIDLEKSGITGTIGAIHIHNNFTEVGQVLKITSAKFAKVAVNLTYTEDILAADFAGKEVTSTAAAYAYIGYIDGAKGNGNEYLVMDVEGDISQLRIEFAGIGTYWITENAEGTLLDMNGNTFPTTGKQTLVIDLEKSGVVGQIGAIHVHNNFTEVGQVLKITSAKFAKKLIGYEDLVLPVNDDSRPVITASCPETAKQGDQITITATATDNYTASPAISYEVTVGTKQVTVTDGKFTATEAGTYSIVIRATDENDNDAVTTLNLVVSACTEHVDENSDGKCDVCGADMPKDEEPTGGCQGCSASGGIFGTLILCLGAAAMVFARRKRN